MMSFQARNRDLKQSEDLQTLEKIAHYASQLQATIDAQAALDAFGQKPF
jgi:hypothetical protein